jgi:hypothetical protein
MGHVHKCVPSGSPALCIRVSPGMGAGTQGRGTVELCGAFFGVTKRLAAGYE